MIITKAANPMLWWHYREVECDHCGQRAVLEPQDSDGPDWLDDPRSHGRIELCCRNCREATIHTRVTLSGHHHVPCEHCQRINKYSEIGAAKLLHCGHCDLKFPIP